MFLYIITYTYSGIFYLISVLFTFISTLHAVLPLGLDVGLLGVAAYYFTRLRKPDRGNVEYIFGPEPGSKEAEMYPEKVVKGIAHRGAGWDAPENTLEAFKYVSNVYFYIYNIMFLKTKQYVSNLFYLSY